MLKRRFAFSATCHMAFGLFNVSTLSAARRQILALVRAKPGAGLGRWNVQQVGEEAYVYYINVCCAVVIWFAEI
jgi:hypothetical protein